MASFTVPCSKTSSVVLFGSAAANNQKQEKIVNLASVSSISRFPCVGFQLTKRKQVAALKVQARLNEVTTEKSSKSAPKETSNGSVTKNIPDEATVTAFMAQVSDLIKLVDSKDIVELNLKQLDCEVIIRKKEALQPPPMASPVMTMPPSLYSGSPSAAAPPPPPTPVSSAPALPPPSAPKKPSGSSYPPLKCPMAGTFYGSPGPGEPPFVKVGDKVQKGQVICIIEAMKLMNEIEADQTGTIAEVLVDDGKPVSVDTPLYVIIP